MKDILLEKLFELIQCDIHAEFDSSFGAAFHFRNLLKGVSVEVIQQQPTALNLR